VAIARIIQASKHLNDKHASKKFSILCIVGIILITVWQADIWTGPKGAVSLSRLQQQIEQQKQKNLEQRNKNDQIYREIVSLKQSHAIVETKAREDLGMIKKGEVYYQIGNSK
jgi:cell division protein FtsB